MEYHCMAAWCITYLWPRDWWTQRGDKKIGFVVRAGRQFQCWMICGPRMRLMSPVIEIAHFPPLTNNILFCHASAFIVRCLVVQGIPPALLGISNLPPRTFWNFHFTVGWTENWRFPIPTIQPLSKTKLSVQAWQKQFTLL